MRKTNIFKQKQLNELVKSNLPYLKNLASNLLTTRSFNSVFRVPNTVKIL